MIIGTDYITNNRQQIPSLEPILMENVNGLIWDKKTKSLTTNFGKYPRNLTNFAELLPTVIEKKLKSKLFCFQNEQNKVLTNLTLFMYSIYPAVK